MASVKGSRNFSERTKLAVLKSNLLQNEGVLTCAAPTCLRVIKEDSDIHFDHIIPYSKGGSSTLGNCQILCSMCNLKKNDALQAEFEARALALELIKKNTSSDEMKKKKQVITKAKKKEKVEKEKKNSLSKDKAGQIILEFYRKNGRIGKKELNRRTNRLPTESEVKRLWGSISAMKKALNIDDGLRNWTDDAIIDSLREWSNMKGGLKQSDLVKENRLPSLPLILRRFPQFDKFSDVASYLGLDPVRKKWKKSEVIASGREFLKKNGTLTQPDLKRKNNLPSARIIERMFGSLEGFQIKIGAKVTNNKPKNHEDFDRAVAAYFKKKGTNKSNFTVVKIKDFFNDFAISEAVVYRNFGSAENFFKQYSINYELKKKSRFTESEVVSAIEKFVLDNNCKEPPKRSELVKFGLPSSDTIEKFFDSWREPFLYYIKINN